MPLVRISLRQGKPPEYCRAVGDAVHRTMVEAIAVPAHDRFQVITEHGPDGLVYPPEYLGHVHTDDIILVQITLNEGRGVELKRALYRRITGLLADAVDVRAEDVIVNLVEVPRENWSFGGGVASYAPGPA
jgi:4-oxalocrotonate tautomerase